MDLSKLAQLLLEYVSNLISSAQLKGTWFVFTMKPDAYSRDQCGQRASDIVSKTGLVLFFKQSNIIVLSFSFWFS